jgi:hypothetical protein
VNTPPSEHRRSKRPAGGVRAVAPIAARGSRDAVDFQRLLRGEGVLLAWPQFGALTHAAGHYKPVS